MSRYTLASLSLISLFLLTAHTFDYEGAIAHGWNDVRSYHFLATHDFSDDAAQVFYPHHRLERWPIHVVIGFLSRVLDSDVWTIYRISVLLLVFTTFQLIGSLDHSDVKKTAIFSFLLFNPYTFRAWYAVPAMISDCLLFSAFVMFICGVLRNSTLQIITAVLLAVLSRQTSILLIPILVALYFLKYVSLRNTVASCLILVSGFITIKVTTVQLYGEPDAGYFIRHLFGIVVWMRDSFAVTDAARFIGRYILFLMTLSGFAFLFNRRNRDMFLFLALFFFIHLQPLVGGPSITGGNIQRICALGLPFLIPLVTYSDASKRLLSCFIFISVLVSFHHNSTILYTIAQGKSVFFALVLTALFFSLYCWHKTPRPESS